MSQGVVRSLLTAVALFLLSLSGVYAQSQRDNLGTEFYVAFGPNEGGEGSDPTRNLMALYLTSKVTAHGKVEVPALGFFQTFTTTPGKITTINLPNGNDGTNTVELQNSQAQRVIKGLAVHITSDSEVAVFGMNHKLYSSDAFMALPLDVLGTEYRTMNYVTSNMNGSGTTPGEFWVIAVFDSTNVTIKPKDRTSAGGGANQLISVRLNKGDVYLVQGSASDVTNDLTGSLIESDQPIAVFSGHRRTQIPYNALNDDGNPSRDHLVEQLPPVSAWGDSALVVPFKTSPAPDLVRVVFAEDQTELTVNGSPIGVTFNAGDFYEIPQLKTVTSIHATKPIQVGQYSHTSVGGLQSSTQAYGDPALALVFPVEQFTTSYTIISVVDQSSYTGNFVNIVTEQDAVSSMQIDGTTIPASEFRSIPGSRYVYAQHELVQGTHNLTGDKPFGITVYGLGPVDSYAYTGGTLLKTITPLKTVDLVIDFGDRVLGAGLAGKFDTVVYLRNVSEDVVNIFDFPRRTQDTGKFHVIDPPVPGYALQPGQTGQMTIEFEPREVDRRMHTKITAKTDHLRAYVVDVYGRGVTDQLGLFRDTLKIRKIQVIDFGVFEKTDPAADSVVYIGNAGTVPLTVSSVAITGADKSDFSTTRLVQDGSNVAIPFTIKQAPSGSTAIGVRFTPSGANGPRSAMLLVSSASGGIDTVILLARIETIVPLTVPVSGAFDSTEVCDAKDFDIPLQNPNGLPITLETATITGSEAGDFVIATPVPITIAPGATEILKIKFQPTDRGVRTAQAELRFDLPKNAGSKVVALQGVSDKRQLEFYASEDVSVHAEDIFLLPIYAKTDLTPFQGIGYTVRAHYDSTYLELQDIVTTNTLVPSGVAALYTYRGNDTIIFAQPEGKPAVPIVGGGPGSLPLVYLRFKPHMNGEDPETFSRHFTINYTIDLLSPKISVNCADVSFNVGSADIHSLCDKPFLTPKGKVPTVMMLEPSRPNPFNPSTEMEYDVATEGPVKIEVYDEHGSLVRVLVNEHKQPGYYTARLDANDLSSGAYYIRMTAGNYERIRRVILMK